MKLIQQRWEEYRDRLLVPIGASGIQQIECRRAFFGGAASLLSVLIDGLDPHNDPTPADLARLNAITAELHQFAKDVKEHRA